MKIYIHRGAKQISGSCVELEADGKRLLLDIELPTLDTDLPEIALHAVSSLENYYMMPDCLALLFLMYFFSLKPPQLSIKPLFIVVFELLD